MPNRFLVTYQYDIEPFELLIIAVFRQAARDLNCDTKKWRRDANAFFLREGFTENEVKIIEKVWKDDI